MERCLELSHPLVSARSPPLWPHLLSPASGIHLANQWQGDRRISCWLVTPHNGLTWGGGGAREQFTCLTPFPLSWQAAFPSEVPPEPPVHSDMSVHSWPEARPDLHPYYRLSLETNQGLCGRFSSWQSEAHQANLAQSCQDAISAPAGRKRKGRHRTYGKSGQGSILRAGQTRRRSHMWKPWMSLESKARTLVQVSAGMGLLLITTSCAHWKPPVECHAVCVPTMSPSSQSRVFCFEEQFPRGCFSFSRQVQYQTECVCSGEGGMGESTSKQKVVYHLIFWTKYREFPQNVYTDDLRMWWAQDRQVGT